MSTTLHGEAGGCIKADHASAIEHLKDQLKAYKVEFVFNMDGTALFYQSLPDMTYFLRQKEQKKNIRGKKKAKARISLVVCLSW